MHRQVNEKTGKLREQERRGEKGNEEERESGEREGIGFVRGMYRREKEGQRMEKERKEKEGRGEGGMKEMRKEEM